MRGPPQYVPCASSIPLSNLLPRSAGAVVRKWGVLLAGGGRWAGSGTGSRAPSRFKDLLYFMATQGARLTTWYSLGRLSHRLHSQTFSELCGIPTHALSLSRTLLKSPLAQTMVAGIPDKDIVADSKRDREPLLACDRFRYCLVLLRAMCVRAESRAARLPC